MKTPPKTPPKKIELPLTVLEANALLRLIAIANDCPNSLPAAKEDKAAGTWVAGRILQILKADSFWSSASANQVTADK
jgi:hypothetical protein